MMPENLFRELDKSSRQLADDSVRLFHGRGHCYGGLAFINVDWFAPVVWVVIYGEVDQSVIGQITAGLCRLALSNENIKCVVMQQRLPRQSRQQVLYGQLPQKCHASEEGMRYELDFSANQNIGFFMDAKPARQWLRAEANGKRVLNLFAYTCSFSVAALQGGAEAVTNIDMSKPAIAIGQRNHALNRLDIARASFLPHDIFRSTRKLENLGPYDLVVIDPPSRQKGSFEAEKDYGRLLRKLEPMLAADARILACLNAPYLGGDFLINVFAENLPCYSLQQRLPQREDFPEKEPDKCLKMLVFSRK